MERVAVRRAERQAQKEADQHHHSRFFLLTVPAIATICAAVTEWVWALLFCIEATGHLDLNYEASVGSTAPAQSVWDFSFSAHWPVLIGLLLATAPIVMVSMVWLPVQFGMRGAGVWRRGTLIFAGVLANILVVVSGTVVMNYNRQEAVREAVVVEQSAEAQRAMLTASVDDLRGELDTLMNHRSTYVATAASVGADAYERGYVAQARATNDPRLPLLERALGSARRADDLRNQIRQARAEVAQAAPHAATAANVEDDVGRELNTFAQYIEVWRPPFVAFICTIIGIFGAWWVLAMLERMNPKDVLRSGWADDGHRIEHLSKNEKVAPVAQPMEPAKSKVYDADSGDELVYRKSTWAKKPTRKGKSERVEINPDIPADESGAAVDGGARQATSGAAEQSESASELEERDNEAVHPVGNEEPVTALNVDNEPAHPEPPISEIPDLSDEEAEAIEAELAASDEVASNEADEEPHQATANASGDQSDHIEPSSRTPETDPRRLLVAAK